MEQLLDLEQQYRSDIACYPCPSQQEAGILAQRILTARQQHLSHLETQAKQCLIEGHLWRRVALGTLDDLRALQPISLDALREDDWCWYDQVAADVALPATPTSTHKRAQVEALLALLTEREQGVIRLR